MNVKYFKHYIMLKSVDRTVMPNMALNKFSLKFDLNKVCICVPIS